MKRDEMAEGDGAVDGREKDPAVVVHVVPIIDGGMHFADQYAVVARGGIIVFQLCPLDAGAEGRPGLGIEADHRFTQEGYPVTDFGCDEEILFSQREKRVAFGVRAVDREIHRSIYIEIDFSKILGLHDADEKDKQNMKLVSPAAEVSRK